MDQTDQFQNRRPATSLRVNRNAQSSGSEAVARRRSGIAGQALKLALSLAFLLTSLAAFSQHSPEFVSADRKLAAVDAYESHPLPNGQVTVLSDAELNAYFNEGGIKWSDGVSDVRMETQPGVIFGSAHVDFDKVTAKSRSNNPLMMAFTGMHTVRVTAQANGSKGRARIIVQNVSLDGIDIPKAALEFFIEHYLQPKYPEVEMDTIVGMPDRIDSAVVGNGQVTLAQR